MQYKILAVNPKTREYSTKFGDMVSYQVKFEDMAMPVEISKKATSQPPKEGDMVEGTIDMSGSFGPKFKAAFNGGAGGSSSFGGGSSPSSPKQASRHNDDPFTMYLSYAKDLVVTLQETSGYDEEKFNELLTATIKGGKALYDHRPGAPATESGSKPDVEPSDEDMDKAVDKATDFFKDMGKSEVVELEDWPEEPKK